MSTSRRAFLEPQTPHFCIIRPKTAFSSRTKGRKRNEKNRKKLKKEEKKQKKTKKIARDLVRIFAIHGNGRGAFWQLTKRQGSQAPCAQGAAFAQTRSLSPHGNVMRG